MRNQSSNNNSGELAEVFRDVSSHMLVSGIIRDQLTTSLDVREEALKGLDFTGFTKILDIGCGFGFFTGGLSGRLSQEAEVTGIDLHEKYRKYYLASAEKAGIKGRFISKGISVIDSFNDGSYDLIICSYALYFFPDYIHQISRILKDQGLLVVITHSCPHMKELTYLVKEILASENISHDSLLPYEMLINRFCDYNGNDMLSAFFRNVNRKEFRSEILFDRSNFSKFVEYFRFKTPFFIPSGKDDEKKLSNKILNKVKSLLDLEGSFHITKDDTIYVCSKPLNLNKE
jgi:ubiquinone/menaquinone biosynthesis C-methylase UbiE